MGDGRRLNRKMWFSFKVLVIMMWAGIAVNIPTGSLRAGRPRSLSLIPGGWIYFSLLHVVHTGSWAYPASYPVGTGCFSGVKRQEHEADHSPPSSVVVKSGGAIPPLSHKPRDLLYLFIMKAVSEGTRERRTQDGGSTTSVYTEQSEWE
jgi:hypothetical protein